YTMRIERFHETWNGSQASAERWLTAYTADYNHHRSHQALDNQPPVKTLKQEGSI
ncbi:MAG: putative transposase, partial [Natronomonas sp.]